MKFLIAAIIVLLFICTFAATEGKAKPWQQIPKPEIPNNARFLSEIVEFEIALNFEELILKLDNAPLEELITKDSKLPFVTETKNQSQTFSKVGDERIVYLSDASKLQEAIIEKNYSPNKYVFRYQTWNYSSNAAKAVDYAIGEFQYLPIDNYHTKIIWTYSFVLKPKSALTLFGKMGEWAFRKFFLDTQYRQMMKLTAKKMVSYSEDSLIKK